MSIEPKIDGWLPPEWAPQCAVMLTWPHESADWWRWLDRVDAAFAAIAREIQSRQVLWVNCHDAEHEARIRGAITAAGGVPGKARYHHVVSDDAWVRDHGPITVMHGGNPLLLDFRFNGWGGKYDAANDDALNRRLHEQDAFDPTPMRSVDFVLEGGSIETDGAGTLLTTDSCLLSPGRNPGWSKPGIESLLCDAFGTERVLWLGNGILEGDDTDGHIDTLARFCGPRTIAYQSCDDDQDPHHGPLTAMRAELESLRTLSGDPYDLVPLPLPSAKYDDDGKRLPAGYANFLIINDAVLVPVYDDAADPLALNRLSRCFPGRDLVPVDGLPIINQYGSVHCVTMQLPMGVLR